MRQLAFPLLLPLLALPAELVNAVQLGIRQKSAPGLRRRAGNILGTSALTDNDDFGYFVNITLGGAQFEVQIDTGSSDLYVAGTVPNTQNTGKTSSVAYAVGQVSGPILTAELDFLGYNVPNQAFLNVAANPQNQTAGTGLIGLGPSSGSEVRAAIGNSSGDPALDRIFAQNTTAPNYITVLLGRADDPYDPIQGNMTIGEVLPEYSNLTSMPKLDVTILPSTESSGQHFQTLLDSNGVIGPTGEAVDVSTVVASTSDKTQLTVVFDTGYTLPQVSSAIAEAFYGSVPGAQLVNIAELDGPIWQFACDYEINVTWKFGGNSYPINPIDTSLNLNGTDGEGKPVCYGAFQPIDAAQSSLYDLIFGMGFLRNIYLLVDYGDFIDDSNSTASPYVQMLSMSTDAAAMHEDFIKLRGNAASWTPKSTNTVYTETKSWIESHESLVIGVSIGAGVLLVGGIIACCVAGRRKRRSRITPAGFMGAQGRYQPLADPAPPEAHDLHLMKGGGAYNNPWDAHY